jgi:hypothetical protein
MTPQAIDRLVARSAHHPCTRIRGHAVVWPLRERCGEGLLSGFLRQMKVADQTNDGGQDSPELLMVEPLYRR